MNHREHREHRGFSRILARVEHLMDNATKGEYYWKYIYLTQLSMFSRCPLCLGGKSFFKGFKDQRTTEDTENTEGLVVY